MKWPNTQQSPQASSGSTLMRAAAAGLARRVERANTLQRDGRIAEAEPIYLDVLKTDPVNADALHFLGLLRIQQRRQDEALVLIKRALEQAPEYVDAWNNLGNLHKIRDEHQEARRCYERVLAKSPRHHDAWHNLALVLQSTGEVDKAAQCFRALLSLFPESHATRRNLGALLYVQGQFEAAAAVYREWLSMQPDNPIARHLLASCSGEAAPKRAADAFVRETFDSFASTFESVLIEKLEYVAPQRLADALLPKLGAARRSLTILDAGCGTGLCGPLLREHASALVGVDLSSAMIQQATSRDYDQLVVAELGAFLDRAAMAWDVIVSADTLIYFGDLRQVMQSASRALVPGGWLGFTLESLDLMDDRAQLAPSGRYQHSRRHVEAALAEAGLDLVSIQAESLRKEVGLPVPGWVVIARRAL